MTAPSSRSAAAATVSESEPHAAAAVVESLRWRHGIEIEAADISMTNGACAALARF